MSYYDCDDYGALSAYCGANAIVDFEKDPDSTIDFAFDWSTDLGADAIATSTITLPDGLTWVSDTFIANKVAVFVSGGTAGRVYRIVNHVTTTGGRTKDQTMHILVREQ